jgi:integrase/recombinase XerD
VVGNSSPSTFSAKQRDLKLFLAFANSLGIDDKAQRWTPSLSKSFQEEMLSRYSAATAERTMATLKHFARWLCERIVMVVGNPMTGVSSIKLEEPAWNGLSKKDLMQLRSAVDIRLASCKRRDQNPHLEAAVFYLLLNTGLRESELVNLNFEQYSEGRALINVRRNVSVKEIFRYAKPSDDEVNDVVEGLF